MDAVNQSDQPTPEDVPLVDAPSMDVVMSVDTPSADAVATDASIGDVPRLLRPSSGSVMSTRRPTIRWQNPARITEARVELFADRECTRPLAVMASNDVNGQSFVPPADLPVGTVFFRVRSRVDANVSAPSPVWQMRIPRTVNGAPVDTALRTDADFNGDGLADVGFDVTPRMGVRQFAVIFGRRAGAMALAPTMINAPAMTGGPRLVGDVNGDGLVDLAVGSTDPAGGLRVYLANSQANLVFADSVVVPRPANATGPWGAAISAAGDVDQDGYADFLVGAGLGSRQAGQLWLLRGGPMQVQTPMLVATASNVNLSEPNALSASDIDGDGAPELFFSNPLGTGMNGGQAGEVNVYRWSPMSLSAPMVTRLFLMPEQPNQHMGSALSAVGDNNGDGRADLLVNANGYTSMGSTSGAVGWKRGEAMMLNAMVPVLRTGSAASPLARALVQLGDVDGDGFGDAAISRAAAGSQTLLIHRGTMLGLSNTEVQSLTGDMGAEMTGVLGGIGDSNGDGFDDFVAVTSGAGGMDMTLRLYLGNAIFPLAATTISMGTFQSVAVPQ